ncbi:hypothetical protein CsSME_00005822 [Camellia sinensis var. sinensis]
MGSNPSERTNQGGGSGQIVACPSQGTEGQPYPLHTCCEHINWSSVSDQSDLGTVTWKPENTISATWAEFDWRSPSDAKAMNPGRGIESKAMQ